jgi:hypothetical protein
MSEVKIRAKSEIKISTPRMNISTSWVKGTDIRAVLSWVLTMYLIGMKKDSTIERVNDILSSLDNSH